MNYSQQVKLIREAYDAIPELHDGWKEVREVLFDMNVEQEREHRRHRPSDVANGRLSVHDAARLFVVSHLLDGHKEPDRYTVDDILAIRNEVLYAQAWAKKYHTQLDAWAAKYSETWASIDYAELAKSAA